MSKLIMYVVNDPGFFMSHRFAVAKAASEQGYEVHVVTGPGLAAAEISQHFIHHQLSLSRSGLNPLNEFKTIYQLFRLFKKVQPDIIHLVTIKPSIYGGVAARLTKSPSVVFAISGMGSVFVSTGLKASVVKFLTARLYRSALMQQQKIVIFQNPDDEALFLRMKAVKSEECRRIRGSGVDLKSFTISNEPEATFRITFAGRLLKEKGIVEFVEAVKILNSKGVNAEYIVLGSPDYGNRSSVSEEEIQEWATVSNLKFIGFQQDISEWYLSSNLIVLPSYREGLPKSLIEAAAAGRAVVTTDVPGCRDAIEPGRTGLLVKVRDATSLADGMYSLYVDNERRKDMGRAGRELAEKAFTLESVVTEHLKIYQELISQSCAKGNTGVIE